MPTASAEMTQKLLDDFDALGKIVKKVEEHVDAYKEHFKKDPPSAEPFKKQLATYGKLEKENIAGFRIGMGKNRKKYPAEDKYKTCRAEVTNLAKFLAMTLKATQGEAIPVSKAVKIKAASEAKDQLIGKDKAIAKTLLMVTRGEGRTGPKETGVQEYMHIHVEGRGSQNLLYRKANKLVLGIVNFHLDGTMTPPHRNEAVKVAKRSGGTVNLKIEGDEVMLDA